jgi:hypothetical protein
MATANVWKDLAMQFLDGDGAQLLRAWRGDLELTRLRELYDAGDYRGVVQVMDELLKELDARARAGEFGTEIAEIIRGLNETADDNAKIFESLPSGHVADEKTSELVELIEQEIAEHGRRLDKLKKE